MSVFDAVAASGALDPIDRHFARLIRRQSPDAGDVVALTAALLSHERARGHSCVDLSEWAGRPFPTDGPAATPTLPRLAQWRRALAESPLVGDGEAPTPLVVDAAGRVYLLRYWRAERRLAGALGRRLQAEPPAVDLERLAPLFRELFPEPEADASDGQAIAAAIALTSRLALVSGGPGTGKTTTVGRVLALWLAADPDLRVALAAPTGKAAARLGEAVAEQVARLPIDDAVRASFPAGASTLHRLLGYQPESDRFRHHAGRPLAAGALVIDEVSMVDLLLMDAVFDALPPGARVVLLGDKDQLTSVETGSVFGDLCDAAGTAAGFGGGFSQRFAERFEALAGRPLPARRPPGARAAGAGTGARAAVLLRDAAALLTTSYRFRDRPGIGELAAAVRHGDAGRALAVLDDPRRPEVARLEPPADVGAALETVAEPLESYLAADCPAQALERLGAFRVLCARRRGPWGVTGLNAAIERLLAGRGKPVGDGFYPARPILVTANDYPARLYNGDLGVCWPDASPGEPGRLWAFFPDPGGGEPRRLPLARLPAHETAWAMTVHKAQGSEFDRVLLVLGDADGRVLTRDLLYTGATRARQSVVVVATREVLRAAAVRRARRVSGLADALAATAYIAEVAPEPETPDDDQSGQLSLFG